MRLLQVLLVYIISTHLNICSYAEDTHVNEADTDTDDIDLGEVNPDTDIDEEQEPNNANNDVNEESIFYELTPEKAEELDNEDAKYTQDQLSKKMSVCFNAVQHLLVSQHETYKELADEVAEKQGVRQDDALRMIMYTNIVGCYNLLSVEDAEKYVNEKTFENDFYAKITPQSKKVPQRFTDKQSDLFTKVITSINTKSESNKAPIFKNLTGRIGYLYMILAVVCVLGGIGLVVRHLNNQHVSKSTSQSAKKKLKKKK